MVYFLLLAEEQAVGAAAASGEALVFWGCGDSSARNALEGLLKLLICKMLLVLPFVIL